MFKRRGRSAEASGRRAARAWRLWKAEFDSHDVVRASAAAHRLIEDLPESYEAWFEAGLHSKALGDWGECARRNQHAVALFTHEVGRDYEGDNPAAWNLGIAATALGDWATARQAWTTYGLHGLDDSADPISVPMGVVPVRINPDRPSHPYATLPEFGGTEIVWAERRSPAHAIVRSVPLPESGHRFGDVLLHDGEPKGTRMLDGREVPVFDELARLEDSDLPTWQAELSGLRQEDLQRGADILFGGGCAIDEWSAIRMMCVECSHGSPQDTHHEHAPTATDSVRVGLAGHADDVHGCLDAWSAECPGLVVARLELLW